MIEHEYQFRCGDPEHAMRSSEDGWTDVVLCKVKSPRAIAENPYRCTACGKYVALEPVTLDVGGDNANLA